MTSPNSVERELLTYGCRIETFRESVESSITVKLNVGGYPMVAMSILSDAQELLAVGQKERARQEINKAKWIIQQYLSSPSPAQNAERKEPGKDDAKPFKYRIKVKGGSWHLSDSLPAASDMDSIEAIEEVAQGEQAGHREAASGLASRRSLDELKALWAQLSDVPIDADDCLDADFLHFEDGTPREDVWAWFESQHPEFSVAEMQGSRQRPRSN